MVLSKTELNVEDLPEKAFVDVKRIRDIVKFRLLSASEKSALKSGEADVHVTTPLGISYRITRNELINKYRYTNGKKINLAGSRADKEYIAVRNDNTAFKAMPIPIRYTIKINGTYVNSSGRNKCDYLIASEENGNINIIGYIPAAMFKKMYFMPMPEILVEYKQRKKIGLKFGNKDKNSIDSAIFKQDNTEENMKQWEELGDSNSLNGIHDGFSKSNITNKMDLHTDRFEDRAEDQNKYLYMVIAKYVNSNGSIVAFLVKDKKGRTATLSKAQILNLCNKKLISNLAIAIRNDTGTQYIRGVNIKIDDLPTYRI